MLNQDAVVNVETTLLTLTCLYKLFDTVAILTVNLLRMTVKILIQINKTGGWLNTQLKWWENFNPNQ